ncbi:MAG TPA: arsenite methyltransferase [Bacteroidota bacterium]|jgi:ubiquinone/menaquinone biosynthesis C-methylase UbiE
MNTSTEIKDAVKQKYAEIARGEQAQGDAATSCCGSGGCEPEGLVNMALKYGDAARAAIPEGADLGLGCGTPTAFASFKQGMTVLDLGSGAGIDCFVASSYVGSTGKVIGVDMTEAMIRRANENKAKVNATNVEFRLGEIESLPVENESVDRVISNCVINLVPDKAAAFKEIHRVMKSGGRFTISDIVIDGAISDAERHDAALWAGCISGALGRREYLEIIRRTGFRDVEVASEKKYDYTLSSGAGMFSITVSGTK